MPAVTPWDEVAEGVWVRRFDPFNVNVTVLDVGGGLVVVDTRTSLVEGEEIRASLREISRRKVVGVVNTHHHVDHVLGNGAWPKVPRYGHERCTERWEDIEGLKMEAAGWFPLAQRQDVWDAPVLPPDHTFTSSMPLGIGDREVVLHHPGRGHTDNDIVVHLPDVDVLLAGDLVEEGAPPDFDDSYPAEWPATLTRVMSLASGVVVPGHGEVVDADFVAAQRDELADLAAWLDTPEDERGEAPYAEDVVAVAARRWDATHPPVSAPRDRARG